MTSAINTFLRRAAHRLARLRTVALVSGYLGLGMAPAFADDIDIYVKSVSSGGGGAATIVFLLDSSGSMKQNVYDGSTATHLLNQRNFQVRDAMLGQVTSLPGRYRVGAFRYSGYSGAKMADAEPLEKVLSETFPTGGTETIYIKNPADDVEQVSGQPMRLGEPGLDMSTRIQQDWFVVGVPASGAWTSAGGRNPNHAGNPNYYYQHTSNQDTQTFYLTSTGAPKVDTYLYLIDAATGNVLRTDNDISSGEYTCRNGWDKWGSDQCRRWCSNKDVGKVPGCTKKNQWNYDDADWTPGNTNSALTYTNLDKNAWYIIVAATNSAAGGEAGTFTLDLASPTRGKFWAPTEKVVDEQRVGLRFTDIEVPQGAVINKAYLRFKAEGATSDPTSLNVGYDRAATPSSFLGDDLYSRDIEWQPAFFNVDPWSDGESGSDTTFDVTSLMQQRVDDPAWCSGEVVMLVRGTGMTTDLRIAESFETAGETGSGRPQLVIDWSPGPAVPSCNGVSMTFDITTMTEDVYQDSAGVIRTDTSSLNVSDTQKAGLRFTLLPIPPGVTVTSAKLELVAHATNSDPRPIIISSFNEGLAAPFKSDVSALDARELSGTSVTWTPPAWVAGERYLSPELKDIVEPLFNSVGWERDGAIGFLLEGASSSTMQVRAWERTISGGSTMTLSNFGTMSARLHVTFTSPDPITTVQTHRRFLAEQARALPTDSWTPISGAFLEVAEYFLGRGGYTAPQMASGACATNTAIILTDGEEYADYTSTHTTGVKDITGADCSIVKQGDGSESAWGCTYDLMDALYEPAKFSVKGGDGNPFPYSVATHTVGFGPVGEASGSGLRNSGSHGGGAYHSAKDSAALVTVFEEVVGSIIDAGATIAAPGVAVNALNRFRHLDELYYSLFKPSTKVDWTGNLKRYRFKDGDVVDVNGAVAVDNVDRVFAEASHSWWSATADGQSVVSGGAAENLVTPDTRKLYTYIGPNGTSLNQSFNDLLTSQDGQGADAVSVSNTFITPEIVGVDRLPEYETWSGLQVMAERDQVIAWARGGTDASPRKEFGAAIHGSPILVTYGFDADKNAINTVFVGDNQGILHMVDTGEPSSDSAGDNLANTGGKELFAFIPQELLPNLATLKQNTKSVLSDGYVYGLDGSWTAWKYDKDGDQTIEPSEDEHVYIYGGMRRGGKNVYALDVTTVNRSLPETKHDPRLLWVVQGGEAGTPYENMGQSWSDPSPRWIRWNGERRRVVFFGGGYDAAVHDDNQPFTDAAQLGRQLYMVDAVTGKLLWWGSSEATADTVVADMKYSITAAPVTVDRNANGYVDGIYVVDLAGQIIRFDLNEAAKDKDDLIRGTDVVARLGATADGADAVKDNRRFYEAPTIGLARVQGSNDVLIALASGYREEPTDNATVERFFSLRDRGAWSTKPPSNDTLVMDSLASADGVDELSAEDLEKSGWYLTFDKANAEKGIGTPVIFDFAVLFTSFMPKGAAAPSSCAPDIGTSRLYFMDVITGKGLVDTDLAGASADGRYLDNAAIGIASRVQILVTDDGINVLLGTRIFGDKNDDDVNDLENVDETKDDQRLSTDDFGKIRRAQWFEVYEE